MLWGKGEIIMLSKVDYKLLAFISKHKSVHINEINKHMGSDCSERLFFLHSLVEKEIDEAATAELHKTDPTQLVYADKYVLTQKGDIALQDYQVEIKQSAKKERNEWIRYAITTIIAVVALIRTFLG
jgi:hypothetical protein